MTKDNLHSISEFDENAPALLDEQIISSIRSLTSPGDPDFLKELTDVFFARSPGVIDQIAQSVEAEDPIGYQRASHSLKGSAANIGAMSLSAQCAKMEVDGRSKDLSSASADLAAVRALYSQVKAALESQFLNSAA